MHPHILIPNVVAMEDPIEEETTLCEEIGQPDLDSLEFDASSVGEVKFYDAEGNH